VEKSSAVTMIRKVMVLAIACPIPSFGSNSVKGGSCSARDSGAAGPFRSRPAAPWRRRRGLPRNRGASTATPPIRMPGTSATSSKAAPASTVSPTATTCFIAMSSGRRGSHDHH
jgi:hypothetical protein